MTTNDDAIKAIILPNEGFIRLETAMRVFGCKKTKFLEGVREGVIPKPHKWGRPSLWDVNEIRAAIENIKARSHSSS